MLKIVEIVGFWCVVFIWVALTSAVGSPSLSEVSVTLVGDGGIIANSDRYWETSSTDLGFITGGTNYNSGTAISHTVTGPGYSTYTEHTKTENRNRNVLDSSTAIDYAGNGISWNMYHVEDYKANVSDIDCTAGVIATVVDAIVDPTDPTSSLVEGSTPSHQRATAAYAAFGQRARYEVDAVIDDTDMTTSARAEGGVGGFTAFLTSNVEAGFNKTSAELNFRKGERMIFSAFGDNDTEGFGAAIDWEWTDHSTPFEQGMNYTVNSTVPVLNETVNATMLSQ